MAKRIGFEDNIIVTATKRTPTSNSVPVPANDVKYWRRVIHPDGRIEFIPQSVSDNPAILDETRRINKQLASEHREYLKK